MIKQWIVAITLLLSVNAWATTVSPKRIIALAPHIVESLYEIGAGDNIVATVDYADYPAQALNIPRVGGYHGLQMEKILQLKPDLIIVWKNGNRQQDIEQLVRLGLPLAYSTTGSVADVAAIIEHLGEVTHKRENAKIVADKYRSKLASIRAENSGKAKIKAFYQLWSEPLRTINKNTFIHEMLNICGANNVFADVSTEYPQISLENVVVARPELIVIPDEKSEVKQPKIDWQPWQMIPAVKNNAFIHVNADLIHRSTSRLLDGLADMCNKIDKHRKPS